VAGEETPECAVAEDETFLRRGRRSFSNRCAVEAEKPAFAAAMDGNWV
jgi:hypothetical protein